MIHREYFWDFNGAVDYTDRWLFMGSPFPMLAILVSYLYFVLRFGPKFMEKRPAYKLRKMLIVYNACQVALSMYIFHIGASIIADVGLIETSCSLDDKDMKYRITSGCYIYFLAKMSEFLDTIFFVLRKKWNQISFLHVYHHFIMYVTTWVTLKYGPTFSVIFLGTFNCFVHIIMYTYYCLSAFPGLSKYLWWKRYITKIQVIQFTIVTIQVLWNFNVTPCPPSYVLLAIVAGHGLLFTYLFTDFYIQCYVRNQRDEQSQNDRAACISKNGFSQNVLNRNE